MDAVFILNVDEETLTRRLSMRESDEFGGQPHERDIVLHLRASGEDMPVGGHRIDATCPVSEVTDAILALCGLPPVQTPR